MTKLLNSEGKPIKKEVDPSQLPTTEQILKDPITKKFVFLIVKITQTKLVLVLLMRQIIMV